MKIGLIYDSALASFSVEEFGTQALQSLSKNKIYNRIKYLKDLTSFDSKLINFDIL